MQNLNRRRFLGAAVGTGAAAAAAGAWVPSAGAQGRVAGSNRQVPNNRIGIQLYTMREQITQGNRQSVRRVLNFLGANGFSEVETAGYYGFTAAQLRSWLDSAGLRAASGHDPLNIDPESTTWAEEYKVTLDNANTLGQKLTGLAYQQEAFTEERYKQLAQRFNEAGALAKAAGLQFFYHNHNFEFENKRASDGAPLLRHAARGVRRGPRQVRARPVLDHRGQGEPARVPVRRPVAVRRVPRQGPHLEAAARRGAELRGRRARGRSTSRTSSPPASAARRPTSTTSSRTTRRGCRIPMTRRRSTRPRSRA